MCCGEKCFWEWFWMGFLSKSRCVLVLFVYVDYIVGILTSNCGLNVGGILYVVFMGCG